MTDIDAKELLLEILNKAQEGKSVQFRLITSWDEFIYHWRLSRSTKLIIKTLKTSASNLFKEYCQDVIVGISDINKLLAYSQLCDIIAFYERELDTFKRMLDEYDNYLGTWHTFWYAFLGGEREF